MTFCTSIGNFELLLLESPQANQPEDLIACKLNEMESVTFDLTLNESSINATANNTFTYYETSNLDGTFQDEITAPTSYTSIFDPQTIYVTVENTNGCINSTSFNLRVDDCEIYIPNGFSD